MKEIEENTNRWKNILCSWIGRINIAEILYYQKQSIDTRQFLSKITMVVFTELE